MATDSKDPRAGLWDSGDPEREGGEEGRERSDSDPMAGKRKQVLPKL